jgi:Cu-Zn family superoxide dismutase
MHVHEVGRCEAPFTSAGGHYNTAASRPRYPATNGMHAATCPTSRSPPRTARFEAFTRELQLGAGPARCSIATLRAHAPFAADDYTSDTGGNAGTRYACG